MGMIECLFSAIEHTEFEKKLKNDSPLCIVCFTNSETRRTTSEDVKKVMSTFAACL